MDLCRFSHTMRQYICQIDVEICIAEALKLLMHQLAMWIGINTNWSRPLISCILKELIHTIIWLRYDSLKITTYLEYILSLIFVINIYEMNVILAWLNLSVYVIYIKVFWMAKNYVLLRLNGVNCIVNVYSLWVFL